MARKGVSPAWQIADAIESGDVNRVREVFDKFPEQINNGEPVVGCHLQRACRGGNLEVVRAMVEMGADINQKDARDGRAPINEACAAGRVEVVRYLLSLGCKLDVSSSLRNPLFSCIASTLPRNDHFGRLAGYSSQEEVYVRLKEVADLLIEHGIDLTACYIQQSMVDMDAAAFARMFGQPAIADAVVFTLYGHDERLLAGAIAEAEEVAVGNAFSREKFRRRRYPPKRGKSAGQTPPSGEYWAI